MCYYTTVAEQYAQVWRNGRRAGFRFQCWETCGFKSRHLHHGQSILMGCSFFVVQNRIEIQPRGLFFYPRDLKVPQSSRIVAASSAFTRLACSLLCWLRFTQTVVQTVSARSPVTCTNKRGTAPRVVPFLFIRVVGFEIGRKMHSILSVGPNSLNGCLSAKAATGGNPATQTKHD